MGIFFACAVQASFSVFVASRLCISTNHSYNTEREGFPNTPELWWADRGLKFVLFVFEME